MSRTVHIMNLLISLVASAVLLFIGIYGLVKKDVSVTALSTKEVKTSEWGLIALGVILLAMAVWNYVICHNSQSVSFCSSSW